MSLIDYWIKQATASAAEGAVRGYLSSSGVIQQIVNQAIYGHPAYKFMRAMQLRYLERAHGLTPQQAWEHGRINLASFLKGDGIRFGDSRYDWSEDGARILVDEDLTYWEAASPTPCQREK